MKITLGSVLFFKPEHGQGCVTVSSITKYPAGTAYYYYTSEGKEGCFTESAAQILFDLSRPAEGGFVNENGQLQSPDLPDKPKSIIDALMAKSTPQYQEVKQLSGPHNWIYIVPAEQEQEFKELVHALDNVKTAKWAKVREEFESKFGHLRTGKYSPRLYIKLVR